MSRIIFVCDRSQRGNGQPTLDTFGVCDIIVLNYVILQCRALKPEQCEESPYLALCPQKSGFHLNVVTLKPK